MTTATLIVAAGRGSRAGGTAIPKQYVPIGGRSALERSLSVFTQHPKIDLIQVVIHPDDTRLYERATADAPAGSLLPAVPGGATRQASVLVGLEALLRIKPHNVLIHDAARPFVASQTIDNVLRALETCPGAIPALPVVDTLKRAAPAGRVAGTMSREGLHRAQTPQGFDFGKILDAHRAAADTGRTDFPDDASIAEWAGLDVALVAGSEDNFKITTQEDFERAERMVIGADMVSDIRTGSGFDVHRFTAGDHVWLGGIRIAHTHRLDGHSDADVALHALTDAILGALGDGDIGQHFPPSDDKWKGASSHIFLADAARRARNRGGRILNVDLTILCEAPKIGPHRQAMRDSIAGILGIDADRVGVKATTTEGLGFTGRREGIAAMATATLRLPNR